MNADNSFNIAAASPSDLEQVLFLLTAAKLPHEGVAEHFDNFIIARDVAGRLVGCAGIEWYDQVGLLRSVAVAPDLQRSGLGTRLTAALLRSAAARDIREVVLLTTTAQDFFAGRFGFTEVTRAAYEDTFAASFEWRLPRCASAAVMKLNLREVEISS